MNKNNFFVKLVRSFTDFNFYREIIGTKLSSAFGYIVILALIIGILTSIRPVVSFDTGLKSLLNSIKDDMPEFTLKNGLLTVEGEMPIIIKDADRTIIINSDILDDPNYDDTLATYNEAVYITGNKIYYKEDSNNTRIINYATLGAFEFNRSILLTVTSMMNVLPFLMVLFIIIGSIVGKLFSSLIVSVLAIIINAIIGNSNLQYKNLYIIGIYTMTLPSLIKLLLNVLYIEIPFFWVIYYAIVIFYLYNGINNAKKSI